MISQLANTACNLFIDIILMVAIPTNSKRNRKILITNSVEAINLRLFQVSTTTIPMTQCVLPAPFSPPYVIGIAAGGGGGLKLQSHFQKAGGLDRTSSFRGEVAGKERGELFQGRGVVGEGVAIFT